MARVTTRAPWNSAAKCCIAVGVIAACFLFKNVMSFFPNLFYALVPLVTSSFWTIVLSAYLHLCNNFVHKYNLVDFTHFRDGDV